MARRQRGQVLENGDGSYSIRYRLPNGRKKQEGTFRTKRQAQTRLNEVLAQIASGAFREDVTFDALADRWLAMYDRSTATRSRVTYQLRHARSEFGPIPVRRITPEQVGEWRLTISEGQRHQVHALVRQVLGAAVRWGYVAHNAAGLVDNPLPPAKTVDPFDEWAEVIAIADELGPFGGVAIVGVGTGLRPEEWTALEWRDVDLEARVVMVRRTFTEENGLVEYGKTDNSRRRVPLRALVVDYLRENRRAHGLVLPSAHGRHIRIRNFRRREWYDALEAAGVQKRRPYAMRHTYAAWSLAAGVNAYTLARRMGTSVEMIDRTYGHLVRDADEHEAGLLDAFDGVRANGR